MSDFNVVSRFTARRIAVTGLRGGPLFHVHPREAERMLAKGQAVFVNGKTIQLPATLSNLHRSEKQDWRAPASSTKTTYTERVCDFYHLVQHKAIDTGERFLYNLVQRESYVDVSGKSVVKSYDGSMRIYGSKM